MPFQHFGRFLHKPFFVLSLNLANVGTGRYRFLLRVDLSPWKDSQIVKFPIGAIPKHLFYFLSSCISRVILA